MKRFRGGLVFKAHRLLDHSTLCSRVIKKKKKDTWLDSYYIAVSLSVSDRLRVGEVLRGKKMALRGTDPESYLTDYTLAQILTTLFAGSAGSAGLGVEQTKTLFLVEELTTDDGLNLSGKVLPFVRELEPFLQTQPGFVR